MKSIIAIFAIFVGVLFVGCASSKGLPKIVSFWVEYGPEKHEPTSYRSSIQIIDLERRETEKLKLALVKIFVFRNSDDKKMAILERKVRLPDEVKTNVVWFKNSVKIEIASRVKTTIYFSELLMY